MDKSTLPPKEQISQEASQTSPAKSKYRKPLLFGLVTITIFIIGIGSYLVWSKSASENPKPVEEMTGENSQPAAVFVSEFATYKEIAVKVTPKVPSFSVSQDLNNVSNATDFTFSPETKKLLVKNAFVVQPDYYDEFFPLYESNRYSFTPNFVTTDSMLHNYHLMFDFLLKQLEEQKLATELQQLNTIMLAESLNQYNSLKG